MKRIDYRVMVSDVLHSLIEEVNSFIENGWEPIGGVAVSLDVDHRYNKAMVYMQAMVKHNGDSSGTANFNRESFF